MTPTVEPRDTTLDVLPPEAAPFLGIAVAEVCYQQQGGVAGFIRRYADEELRYLARHLASTEFETVWARSCIELEYGAPMSDGPSW